MVGPARAPELAGEAGRTSCKSCSEMKANGNEHDDENHDEREDEHVDENVNEKIERREMSDLCNGHC